jgi:putative glutamine amidotransferase
MLPPDDLDGEVASRLDGLVLVGGADIDARRYGAEPHATADKPRVDRDASELLLYAAARRLGLPVLGICRGLQLMAVAHGGSLHQHLPDLASSINHRDAPGTFEEHGATFVADSLIARLYGTTSLVVNSSHHQCVAEPGTLTVTGFAEDATIEVLEDPTAPFVLGVQWHPERPDRTRDRVLFDALVTAARRD